MKKFIYALAAFIALVVMSCNGCEKAETKPQLSEPCGNGFVANSDNTECICPEETHYKIGDMLCDKKGENIYKVTATAKNCIGYVKESILDNKTVGLIELGNKGSNARLYWGDEINERATLDFFYETSLVKLSNGASEFRFSTGPIICYECSESLHWSDQAYTVKGYGHGISNPENTEMDIEIIYKSNDGVVVDTGYLHLWK